MDAELNFGSTTEPSDSIPMDLTTVTSSERSMKLHAYFTTFLTFLISRCHYNSAHFQNTMPVPCPAPSASSNVARHESNIQPIATPHPEIIEFSNNLQDPSDYHTSAQLRSLARRPTVDRPELSTITPSVSSFLASGLGALPPLGAATASTSRTVLGGNTVSQRPAPYPSSWTWSPRLFWSIDFVARGHLNETDAALLVFMVDCAMKLYIVADLEVDFDGYPSSTKLTFAILERTKRLVRDWSLYPETLSVVQSKLPAPVIEFLTPLVLDLSRIRERCDIMVGQNLQDPNLKIEVARTLMNESRFKSSHDFIMEALEWVYGEDSLEGRLDGKPVDGMGIEIREWIFEHN
jgi:hypothetical protein